MTDVPSNLIPTRITQLPLAPVADENSLMMIVYQGQNYQIRVGDLLSVAGVPTTRQVIAGTGMTGGGQLSSNVTLSIAPGGVGSTELANSGVTPGSYGTATDIPVFTVDATGRVMAATTVPATISGYVPESRQVIAGTGLTGGGALTSNVTLTANLSNATPQLGNNTGSAGVSTEMSRADHVHPAVDLSDQAQINGILPLDQGGTARSLVANAGAVVWSGADGLYISAAGAPGQVLVSGGTGAPTWGSAIVVSDQPANVVYAGPAAGPAAPTAFRSLVTADLPNSGASAGTYGSQAVVPVITVNGKGQVTAATNTTINAVTLTTGSITTAPTNGTDIVNKNYADSIATGINFHQACRLASAAALPSCTYNNGVSGVGATLTATANAALSVDSTLVALNNRVLIKNQVDGAQNGVYVVTQTGNGSTPFILTRATDFDTPGTGVDNIDAGDFFLITAGSTNANTSWVQQTPLPITVGTTPIVFSQFGASGVTYTAGTGLTLTGTVFSITNTAVAAGSYGSASSVGTFTVNAQGQLTAASSASIAIGATQITSGTIDTARISGSYTGITGVGTLTTPTVVSVNSASDALRITQTGTGNALVVEDSANPDATPFVVDNTGIVGIGEPVPSSFVSAGMVLRSSTASTPAIFNWNTTNDASTSSFGFRKDRAGAVVGSGDLLGLLRWQGFDGASYRTATQITGEVDGTPGTNDMPGRLVFSTTADGAASPTERMRIDSNGAVGIGSSSLAGYGLRVTRSITGAATARSVLSQPTFQSDVTSSAYSYDSIATTAAGSFTLPFLFHYSAAQGTFGAGSSVTTQMGYFSASSLVSATNNYGFFAENTAAVAAGRAAYGFYSNVNTATGGGTAFGFFANGTAPNYFNGNVGIGTSSPTQRLDVSGTVRATAYAGIDGGTF